MAAMLCHRSTTATHRELLGRFRLSHPDSASDQIKRGKPFSSRISHDTGIPRRVALAETYGSETRAAWRQAKSKGTKAPVVFIFDCSDQIGGAIARGGERQRDTSRHHSASTPNTRPDPGEACQIVNSVTKLSDQRERPTASRAVARIWLAARPPWWEARSFC